MSLKNQLEERLKMSFEHPELEEHGDFSSNIALKNKGGRKLAEVMAAKIKTDDLIDKVEVAGAGFINIWLQTDALVSELQRVLNEGDSYGSTKAGAGKTVVIDYSAPNIAKRFGIGHLRSTIIGQALYNLYAFLGYKTIGDNHLGDWGTQFGKLLYMIDKNGGVIESLDKLEEWYVEFHEHPEWEDEGRAWFKKLEGGDEIARSLWKQCIVISFEEYDRLYKLMNVKIDFAYGESFYEDKMETVLADANDKQLATVSEGATVIKIPGLKVPLMLLKSDGGTTYATRDLATVKFRMHEWQPELILYEVGAEQTLHFQQVIAVAQMLGYVSKDTKLVHTKHGLYLSADGKKFKTRTGNTVNLQEVFNEAIERAKKLGNVDEATATQVGVGAIKYFDLSHNLQSDIVFDWETIMALDGNSGPYIQYVVARINSLMEKGNAPSDPPLNLRGGRGSYNLDELRLLRWIYRFSEAVEEAALRYSPNLLCNYLFELGQRFNSFYNQHSILTADNIEVKNFRLVLSAATGQVLKNSLRLLGIESPERM